MASTYVNDLRLNELGTGDASGTWGTITNLNLELIGEGLSYGTQDCFTTDADATTTVADGASDPARAMYFKVTSSATLTATRTLTIAPNTVSRLQFIENATTGSQSINISQGSGANVTIPTGATKVVYLDGAGASAAVVDALADLSVATIDATTLQLGGTSVTATATELNYNDITTLGTVEASKVVTADANGDVLFPDNEKLKVGTGGDLEIYHDASHSYITDGGTGNLKIGGSQIDIEGTSETMAKFIDDGAVELYYDNSKKFETVTGGIAVTGAITATGDITAFYSSDETLKTNIENIENATDKVMAINGVRYNWTDEAQANHDHLGEAKELGVIAQQVEKVAPEIVKTREDGTKAVQYERLCALLIESIKELKQEINELRG